MPSYRIGQVARLFGVSDDTVRRWSDSGRLPVIRDASGRRTVDGVALAEFVHGLTHEPGDKTAVRSARNRLTGLVTNVTRDGVMAQVDVAQDRSASCP